MGKVKFLILPMLFLCLSLSAHSIKYVHSGTASFLVEENQKVRRGTVFTDEAGNVLIASDAEENMVLLRRLYGTGALSAGSALEKRLPVLTLSAQAGFLYTGVSLSVTGPLYPFNPFAVALYAYRTKETAVMAGFRFALPLSTVTSSSFYLFDNGFIDIFAALGRGYYAGVFYRCNINRFSLSAGASVLTTAGYEYSLSPSVGFGVSF